MPIYEYRCEKWHVFEVMQRMADDPVTVCQVCDASVQRVFHPIAVHFKGKGFYNTDYGTKNRQRELKEAGDGGSSSDGGSSDGASKETTSTSGADGGSGSGSGSSSDSGSAPAKKPDPPAKKPEKAAS